MIYRYTKCESVIAKIMADLDSTEARLRTSDIREWIFEAVEKIGAPMLYIDKEIQLKLEDNLIPLPSDLLVLDGAAYSHEQNGPWKPMYKTTSIFKLPKRNPHGETHQPEAKTMITSQSLFYSIQDPKIKERYLNIALADEPEYFIKPGWLVVSNRNKGFVKLAYKSIATDERGYPLIPDSTSYQEAIYWYVVMKLNFPKMVNKMGSNISGKAMQAASNIYFYTQQQWNFYRNQAYAEAMMPTADDMRNIKNQWNKLVPDWDSDDTFFRHMNDRESIYNDYYYGY